MASGNNNNNNNTNDNTNSRPWEFPFPSARTTGRGVDHSNPPSPWASTSSSHTMPPRQHQRNINNNHQFSGPFGPAAAAWASWMAGGGVGSGSGENHPWWILSVPEAYEENRQRARRAGGGAAAGAAGAGGSGFGGRQRQSDGDTTAANASSSSSSTATAASSSSNNDSATATAGSDHIKDKAKEKSRDDGFTDLMDDDDDDSIFPDPAEVTPTEDDEDEDEEEPIRRHSSPPRRRRGGHAGRHHHHHHHRRPPPPFCRRAAGGAHHGGASSPPPPHPPPGINRLWDMFNNNPVFRTAAERFTSAYTAPSPPSAQEPTDFTPPVDIFRHDRTYVIHVALPGARKADVGVDWDPQRACLRVAGVVHRPGDEDFLTGLVVSERRVGVFDRSVSLPPYRSGSSAAAAAAAEIDAAAITAKMEDGILVVNVPLKDEVEANVQRVKID
ncbi:hypothetical protein CP532_2374 [Ophiocordyceps camponoti-leonardi (nom. inval.)]|nr:hypothetical protein CP532_2374 [Ophiocordyceps camponoti-leonardi (nom. inval.)]